MVITAGGSVKLGKDRAQDPGILDKDGTQHIGDDVEMALYLLNGSVSRCVISYGLIWSFSTTSISHCPMAQRVE